MGVEKRAFERKDTEFDMRVYTSIKSGAYTVKVTNLSKNGAFIKSQHLPKIGETISFELFDHGYRPVHMGNAKVCRLHSETSRKEQGFGVMFYENLTESMMDGYTLDM